MKAIVIETNEVVDILKFRTDNILVKDSFGRERIVRNNGLKGIDWEARRFELVKAAMQSVCGNSSIDLSKSTNDGLAGLIIGLADAILVEYRKSNNK